MGAQFNGYRDTDNAAQAGADRPRLAPGEAAVSASPLRRSTLWQHRTRMVGLALLGLAFGSQALTLGHLQGVALVGQPLNLVVPLQIEAGETPTALCVAADVFHADTRQDASRVRVLVETGSQPAGTQLRILSSAPINEPVVTVYVRAGCAQQTTRRYVLLADLPSAVAAPSAPVPPLVGPPAPAPGASPSAPEPAVQAAAVRSPRIVRSQPASARRTARSVPGSTRADAAAKATPVSGRSRLTLDPLEFLSDRISNLESSAPIATPEDVLQSKQKIQVLEGSVASLLALSAKHEASLADLEARLQKAQASRFSPALVYGLSVLLLACLAALTLLWRRQSRLAAGAGEWWRGAGAASPEPPIEPIEPIQPAQPDRPAPSLGASQAITAQQPAEPSKGPAFAHSVPDSKPSSAVDVKLMDMSDSYFQDLLQSGGSANTKQPAPVPARARPAGQAHNLHTEALLDIRQQAEFFVSLGQPEQAVHILKRQIHESEGPNPLLYLDLLGVLHSLSQKSDFQRVREDFHRCFKGRVPEFVFFTKEGHGLEAYPELLSRITALWPTPQQALALLEASLFKDSAGPALQSFDLAAFRDLLLLHALAHSAALAPASNGGPPSGARPNASAAPEVALDLDLSAAPSAPPVLSGSSTPKPQGSG